MRRVTNQNKAGIDEGDRVDDQGSNSTRWRPLLWPLVAVVMVAAITAVPIVGDQADFPASLSAGRGANEIDGPTGSLPESASTPSSVPSQGGQPSAPGATGVPGVAGDTASTTSPSSAGGPDSRPTGPGISPDKITIGIGWFDVSAYARFFAPSADRQGGSTKDAAQATVDWLNKRGGIAGRQIEPIYHEYPLESVVGSNSSRSAEEQAMCSKFTEDHRAFAAIPTLASQSNFYECAAQHDLVSIATSFSEGLVDQAMFERIGHTFYMPHSLLIDRREEMFVAQLDRRGFFAPDAKVGVIVEDTPPQRRGADRSLFPALKALGVDVVETAYYVPELSTDWSNMVLRFRSAGVTHVVWGASACTFLCAGQFMTASENQRYRPYNALGSDQGIPGHTLVTPPAQRERIVGISWSPRDEGGDAYETAAPVNDADAQCRQVKKDSGIDVELTLWAPYCDALFFIKSVLEAAPSLTSEGFRSAVEAHGFDYPVIDAFAAAWGPNRHDAASSVRDIDYNAECECFRWSGPAHPVG